MPVTPRAAIALVSRLPIESRLTIAAIGFRLVSALVAFLANVIFPEHIDQRFSFLSRPHAFWDTFARYDAGWYHGIASGGYAHVEGGRSNLAFFPLYPMLMGLGGRLLGGAQADFYFAGVAISWVAFALAVPATYRLARLDMPPDRALWAALYLAVLPAAYFFGVVYSESLFLLSLVTAVLALRQGRWWVAAVAGAAMTATRVNGVMFVPALLWIAWTSTTAGSRDRRAAVVAAASSLAGIAAYCAYTYWLSGDPLAWYSSIQRWGYSPGGRPFSNLLSIAEALVTRPFHYLSEERLAPYDALNLLSAVLALALVPGIWGRFGLGYALVVLLGLALPLSSGQPEGLSRYCAVLVPLPIYLASLAGDVRRTLLLLALAMVYTLGLVTFVNAHPL
jgi:hypothetical protein